MAGRVLGAVELAGPNGVLRSRAGKHRVLLGGLLLRANHAVSTAELIQWLWDDAPPMSAKETLYVYLMRLRKEMEREVGGSVRISTVSGAYRLEIDPRAVDVLEFRHLVQESRRAEQSGEVGAAIDMLRRAERLWRGPALFDVPSERLQRDEADRLAEERSRALERWVDLELARGRHSDLLGELRTLTGRYPLHERFWGQLMLALSRDGRQAEALECYQQARTLLIEEFGLEPGDELRALQQRILDGEVTAVSARPPVAPDEPESREPRGGAGESGATRYTGGGDGWSVQCQLPPGIADFVGRTQEAETIAGALTASGAGPTAPVVVLSGPPGVGKSALAIRVGHWLRGDFPDGQWYVHLAGTAGGEPPGDTISDLLRLSGLSPQAIPSGSAARAAALRARLTDRRVLLVVDDAVDLGQVQPLLPSTPGCAVLVTSRQRLTGLPGGHQISLDVLSARDAEQLLAGLVGERAAAERGAAQEIVTMCGRLPLAVRIAGSRLAARPDARLAAFARRLRDRQRRLDELRVDSLGMRASMELSYLGLGVGTQTAFRRLGLLEGADFPSWVLAALIGCGESGDEEQLIERLVGTSLITPVGRDLTGEPRYRMHDLLSVYAADLAAGESSETGRAALRRLLDAFLQIGVAARSRRQRVVWDRQPDEARPIPDVLSAEQVRRLVEEPLAWDNSCRRLAVFVVERACELGWYADAAQLAGLISVTTRSAAQRIHDAIRKAAVAAGDQLVAWRTEFTQARRLVQQRSHDAFRRLTGCLEAFERLGARQEMCYALVWLSMCRMTADEDQQARAYAERALKLTREMDADDPQVLAVRDFISALATDYRLPEVIPAYQQAWRAAAWFGDLPYQWTVLHRFSIAACRVGDLEHARWAAEQGLVLSERVGEPQATAWMLLQLSRVHNERGAADAATESAARARRIFAADGDLHGEAAAAELLGELAYEREAELH
ncbi:AfsR/SARP family transcriptional regulator [Streptomyces palmae]|uniref:AfsR/SARP family transcriptional regulator n=1 Tax=Streptomyces palmae TaxID=1701085 RepID=A0A4Z0H582_9ACTN|nr:AfsR/SARP family transcriptional regulator [Streptomyces palmae]TGB05703.1 AfsR/SARP family transcriptional regulator [Streptomyces palmae]